MAFSGALMLADLNDFITPSQACIKPVSAPENKAKAPGDASTEIHIDSAGSYYEISSDLPTKTSGQKLEQAQINLNDCLACSGCITSAESVLITLQSHTEVLNFLKDNDPVSATYRVPIVSIAPQSLASLSASVSSSSRSPITSLQILRRLVNFFREDMGFADVFDTTFGRHLVLKDHVREFQERKTNASNGIENQLPMLSSACPGWICYAEKTHPEMLPFIAQTKSPQQMMGTLVKEWIAEKYGLSPSDIYHVTVMPCYDKKLEASRSDFYNDLYSTRDVDCVITTAELQYLLRDKGRDLETPVPGELDVTPPTFPSHETTRWKDRIVFPELMEHQGTSSGSYLRSIISHLQSIYPDAHLSTKQLRNVDHVEYTLTSPSSKEVLFKAAKCYGFRNLQNVVRKVGKEQGLRVTRGAAGKLKSRAIVSRKAAGGSTDRPYDYVEVMACPGGCVNGGGQVKPPLRSRDMNANMSASRDEEGFTRQWEADGVKLPHTMEESRWGDREWNKVVEAAYWAEAPAPQKELAEKLELEIEDYLSRGGDESRKTTFFRTQYRAVESDVVGLAVQW